MTRIDVMNWHISDPAILPRRTLQGSDPNRVREGEGERERDLYIYNYIYMYIFNSPFKKKKIYIYIYIYLIIHMICTLKPTKAHPTHLGGRQSLIVLLRLGRSAGGLLPRENVDI